MGRYFCISVLYAALVLGFRASALDAATTVDQGRDGRPLISAAEGWRKELDLRSWSGKSLHDDMTAQIQKLSGVLGQDRETVVLDAAELYLSHMLLFEAASTLDGIEPTDPTRARRHRALTDAARLLAGEASTDATPDFASSPLNDARPDKAFWTSLNAIATSDVQLLSINIEQSFAGLSAQPSAVVRAILPVLLEAAIELDKRVYVDATLRLLEDFPELSNATTGMYLRARAAHRRGNSATALTGYLEAAGGWDHYAVRARLAIADMSIQNGGRGALLAAQNTLEDGAEAWRGGRYELEILRRLEQVYHALENEAESAMVLGKILLRFPNMTGIDAVHEQAQQRLDAVYTKGAQGRYPLAAWMGLHLRLLPYFRYMDGFTDRIETLADYLLDLGSTDLAAREYRRAAHILDEIRAGDPDLYTSQIANLHLKLAHAQVRGGLYDQARLTLDTPDLKAASELNDEVLALMSVVMANAGDRLAFINADIQTSNARHLRSLGLALSEEEQWPAASATFKRLWDTHPDQFSVQDATRLLIASYRSQDNVTLDLVTGSFPSLTSSKHMITLANSISEVRESVLPLGASSAAERLDRLEQAFESIEQSGISP